MAKSTVYAMSWVMPKLLLGPMPYLMPWQLLPYATVKIGVNSIADITNGISIGIGNSINFRGKNLFPNLTQFIYFTPP